MGFILFVVVMAYVAVHYHVFMDGKRKRARARAKSADAQATSPTLLRQMDQLRLDIEAWVTHNALFPPATPSSAAPVYVGGARWTQDRGAIPGEPMAYLDGDEENGVAAVIERQRDGEDGSVYEAVMAGGRMIGLFSTSGQAALAAERFVDNQALAAAA